jgi:hypothetical protein
MIEFNSDKVTIRTGRVDNSAIVSFEVGEYQLDNIKDLIGLVDKNLKITVEITE